jgi:hypothetical protein
VFKFNAPLYYINADTFPERLYELCRIDLPAIVEARRKMEKNSGANSHTSSILKKLKQFVQFRSRLTGGSSDVVAVEAHTQVEGV